MSHDAILAFVQAIAPVASTYSTAANQLNQQADIAWRIRERIRTVEGFLDKIDEQLIEIATAVDTDDAEGLIEALWGPFDA